MAARTLRDRFRRRPARPEVVESDLVLNVVWTGTSFDGLQYFVSSLLDQSEARYRFVANGCPPDQIAALDAYADRHRDQVVEVLDVSEELTAHGVALDRVRAQRDDGDFFCLIDPDIKAKAPFVPAFAEILRTCDVVTSGTEVWSDDNFVPDGNVGVAGEHFYTRSGFVFGSPHLAIYRRSALDATSERWGVGLGSAGPELSDEAKACLHAAGHDFVVYDTTKIVNALLQADGHRLVHQDLPQLVHIGGLSHFLSPAFYLKDADGAEIPEWARYDNMGDRHQVTRYTAAVLRGQVAGDPVPDLPEGLDPVMAEKLRIARDEVVDLVARYRDC